MHTASATARGHELAALWDEFRAKVRQYRRTCKSRTPDGLDHPLMDQHCMEESGAFDALHQAVIGSIGRRNRKPSIVILPDGRYLVRITDEFDYIMADLPKIECVEPENVLDLS